jgi:DNA polymerase-4
MAGKPVSVLGLPLHLECALERAHLTTLGQVADADEAALAAVVGGAAAPRIRAAARGEQEAPIAVAAPPVSLQEEAIVRDRRADRQALEEMVDALARRAARRLKPFRLAARALSVEVRRSGDAARRGDGWSPGLADEEALAAAARALVAPLLDPADGVRALQVRLSRLEPPTSQAPLFPSAPSRAPDRTRARGF